MLPQITSVWLNGGKMASLGSFVVKVRHLGNPVDHGQQLQKIKIYEMGINFFKHTIPLATILLLEKPVEFLRQLGGLKNKI